MVLRRVTYASTAESKLLTVDFAVQYPLLMAVVRDCHLSLVIIRTIFIATECQPQHDLTLQGLCKIAYTTAS